METQANTTASQRVRGIRLETDTLIKALAKMRSSRETSVAYTEIQNAKMHMGKILQELNEPNPYPDSKEPSNTKIEKPTEVSETDLSIEWEKQKWGRTQCVKDLRKRMTAVAEQIWLLYGDLNPPSHIKAYWYLQKAFLSLEGSCMWLGQELNRIMEQETAPTVDENTPVDTSKI